MPIIVTTYEIITEESAADGEAEERGFSDPIDNVTVVEACVLLHGCEPSSSQFHVGIWYTMYGEMDIFSGKTENVSYHLDSQEWTEEQQRAIYKSVILK